MSKVSVLIAVWNAESFLDCCLQSLLQQTLADWQAICVDDASTDGSLGILNSYAQRDERITVIQLPENHGHAFARNTALQRATGDFVCMLDADDWLSPDALQLAVDAFDQQTDAVLFDEHAVYDDGRDIPYQMNAHWPITGEEAFRKSLTWQIHGLYMVRSDIHQRYPYDDTCRLYSDENTTRLHYLASRNVRCCRGIYYYRQHAQSMTHRVSVRRFDALRANERMRQQMEQHGIRSSIIAEYEQTRWLNLVDACMFYHVHGRELSASERRYGLSEIRRIWGNIDLAALKKETTAKFGYRPCKWFWLFRWQEWLYFTLRGFFGKNQ